MDNNSTIPQPAEATYSTDQDAIDALFTHGKEHGYCVRLKRAKPDGKDKVKTKYCYVCDRYGVSNPRGFGVRQTGSLATNCEFQVIIRKIENAGWELEVKNPLHNHGPSLYASIHQGHRRRDMKNGLLHPVSRSYYFQANFNFCIDHIDRIRDQTKSGLNPKHIYASILENDSQTTLTQRDVYNQRLYHREEYLQGRTPLEALLEELKSSDEWVVKWAEIGGRLQSLFFASQDQIKLMRSYPDLVLIDATYKTNRYNMPLLHFSGVTPINTYFSAAFCFMSGEGEDDYMWSVEQFRDLIRYDLKLPEVFITDNDKSLRKALSQLFEGVPRLLCVWHIQQNVLYRVKKTWRLADYVEGSEDHMKMKEKHEQCMKDWNKASYSILSSKVP
jgi:hypothetical protein